MEALENKSNSTKILVCGGRHFNDYAYISSVISEIINSNQIDYDSIEIVSGHCEGADQLGERYANDNKLALKIFPAEWKKYGRSAGPIRNKQMLKYINSFSDRYVIAFMSENSKGTKFTVKEAEKLGIPVFIA